MKLSKNKLKQIIKEEFAQFLKEELPGQPGVLQQLESIVKDIDNLTGSMADEDKQLFLEYLKRNIELRIERGPATTGGPEESPGL